MCKTWAKSVMYMLWRDVVEKELDKMGVHCSEFVCNLLNSTHGDSNTVVCMCCSMLWRYGWCSSFVTTDSE